MRGAEGGRERESVVRGEDVVLPPPQAGAVPHERGARAREVGGEREGGRERGRESPRLLPLRTAAARNAVAHAVCKTKWWIRAGRQLLVSEADYRGCCHCVRFGQGTGERSVPLVDAGFVDGETWCPWWKVDSCMPRLGEQGVHIQSRAVIIGSASSFFCRADDQGPCRKMTKQSQ